MTKLESFISAAAVLMAVIAMLFTPGLASGEPSMGPSGEAAYTEPSAEVPSYSGAEILTNVLMEAAGIETSDDVSDILAGMDTAAAAKELRSLLDMTQLMTDEQLRARIIVLAAEYGYSFTEAELDAIISVIRSFEPLTEEELAAKLDQLRSGYMAVEEVRDSLSSLGDRVQAFIQKLVELFRWIFSRDGLSAFSA